MGRLRDDRQNSVALAEPFDTMYAIADSPLVAPGR
jgi:hypothetical protein